MRKGIFALIGCMLVALLAGCGATGQPANTGSSDTSSKSSTTQEDKNPSLTDAFLNPTQTFTLGSLTMKYPSQWKTSSASREEGSGYELTPSIKRSDQIDGIDGTAVMMVLEQSEPNMRPFTDSELGLIAETAGPTAVEAMKSYAENQESGGTFGDAKISTRNCSTASELFMDIDYTYQSHTGKGYCAILFADQTYYMVVGIVMIDDSQYEAAYEKTMQEIFDSIAVDGETPVTVNS